MLKNKGQSTLEYLIVFAAIIGAVITAISVLGQKSSDSGLGKLMNKASTTITAKSAEIAAIND